MIADFDSHFWLGKTPDGWISQADIASTQDPRFAAVDRLRIEPLGPGAYQSILEAEKPPGYVFFFRHRVHEVVGGPVVGVEYILGLERGNWSTQDAAAIDIDQLPVVDGFRAKLDLKGEVDFEGSDNFTFIKSPEGECDKYKFVRK